MKHKKGRKTKEIINYRSCVSTEGVLNSDYNYCKNEWEKFTTLTPEEEANLKKLIRKLRYRKIDTKGKSVICLETGEVFLSLYQAGKKFNTYAFLIKRAITLGRKTKGYTFKYLDEDMPEPKEYLNRKKVICKDINMTFESVHSAARFFDVSPSAVVVSLKSGLGLKTRKAFNIAYAGE